MKISQGTSTPQREPIVTPVGLRNNTCNVKLTVQMEGFPPIEVTLENENEVRNVIARFTPVDLIKTATNVVLENITDDTNPLFQAMIATGKSMELDLPAGL